MRLTLRTLLAWLDDTLPPVEVREIGLQVAESQFAQELVERVQKVSRQRRLTVPSGAGPDSTDPNVVSAYLDNELPADEVADFEKRCLTSDVHLAEVASVHQILSLIGQKAKVPAEAKERMYRLIRGRETSDQARPQQPRKTRPRRRPAPRAESGTNPSPPAATASVSAPKADSTAKPASPRTSPRRPSRPWHERFGPGLLVAGLLAILGGSIWAMLRESGPEGGLPDVAVLAPRGPDDPGPALPKAKGIEATPKLPPAPTPLPATVPKAGPAAEPKPAAPAAEAIPAPVATGLPPGAVGVVEAGEVILLHQAAGASTWEALEPETPIRDGDRLVGLEHFRSPVRIGAAALDLVGDSEVRAHAAGGGLAARFDWIRGRVVVRGAEPPAPIGIGIGDQVIQVTPPPGVPVGLAPAEAGAGVRVFAPEGVVALAAADAKKDLNGPSAVGFDPPSTFGDEARGAVPGWVTETEPAPLDKQIGAKFAQHFPAGSRLMTGLLESLDDESREVRESAVAALGSIGAIDLVVPALSTPGEPSVRRAAIRVLRGLMARGGEAAAIAHDELRQVLGEEQARAAETLLRGFNADEARRDETYAELVKHLASPDPGIRELSIDNLRTLTGRADLGYNVDAPEGEGIKVWQELLRKKELRPLAR